MPSLIPPDTAAPAALNIAPEAVSLTAVGAALAPDGSDALERYLSAEENIAEDIGKLRCLLGMPHVILEIGCGDGETACRIALKNPHTAVIATDVYFWDGPPTSGSHYQRVALAWKQRQLAVQQRPPANLVVLRAQVEILRYLPAQSVDSLLLIHPEPGVGKVVLNELAQPDLYRALKPGDRQLVVLPYSREMGCWVCGGHEFDHSADWSRGLGFLMESRFAFAGGNRVQWGVDLPRASRYTGNSTQTDVYVAAGMRK